MSRSQIYRDLGYKRPVIRSQEEENKNDPSSRSSQISSLLFEKVVADQEN